MPPPRDESHDHDRGVRRVIGGAIRGRRRRVALICIISVGIGFADAAVLLIVARTAFALTEPGRVVSLPLGPIGDLDIGVTGLIGIAVGIVGMKLLAQLWVARANARMIARLIADNRHVLVRGFLNASWALQSEERQGKLQELASGFTMQNAAALSAVLSLGVAACTFTGLLVTALVVNPIGAVIAAVVVSIAAVAFRPLRTAIRGSARRSARSNLEVATAISEIASEVQEIRVFGVSGGVRQRVGTSIEQHAQAFERTTLLQSLFGALYSNSSLLLLLGALGIIYATGETGIASLGGVVLILLRSLTYGQQLLAGQQQLHGLAPSLEILREAQERYDAAAVSSDGGPVGALGTLTFDKVGFEYLPGHPVLDDLSFTVERGEIIGVIGPSGAGKSTLVQLLLRLRQPIAGRILVDGRSIDDIALGDWYQRVGFVPQEQKLFAGTVAENIIFFRDGYERADVEVAARDAHIHDELLAMTDGYDTPVGERGGRLSGGQRQRLCIARALLGHPAILVLDEPTSALDARSESLIRDTLVTQANRATIFIVAHRLTTLEICDKIMVLKDGKLIGFDQPHTLESTNPFYAEALQLAGLR